MKLTDAIETYLKEARALRDLSKNTIRSYRERIRTFLDFLDDPEMDVASALTKINVVNYFSHLRDRDYAESTIYAKKQALRTLWHWAYREGLVAEDLDIRLSHPPTPQTVYLEPEEAKRIEHAAQIGASRFSILHLRDEAAFALLAETGISISAMTQILPTDYDPHKQTLRVNSCRILLSDTLCKILDRYVNALQFKRGKGAVR